MNIYTMYTLDLMPEEGLFYYIYIETGEMHVGTKETHRSSWEIYLEY